MQWDYVCMLWEFSPRCMEQTTSKSMLTVSDEIISLHWDNSIYDMNFIYIIASSREFQLSALRISSSKRETMPYIFHHSWKSFVKDFFYPRYHYYFTISNNAFMTIAQASSEYISLKWVCFLFTNYNYVILFLLLYFIDMKPKY